MTQTGSIPQIWVTRLSEWARSHERIDRLFVFGSRARGDSREGSDLDVAVYLTGHDAHEIYTYGVCMAERWRSEVRGLLPIAIDLVFAEPEHDEIVHPAVLKEGRMIYCRNMQAG